jgi:hypothetical protein
MAYYEKTQKAAPARQPVVQVCWSSGCRGLACFSTDHGKTWACRAHVPGDFFPHQRQAPRKRRAEPAPAAAPVAPDCDEF